MRADGDHRVDRHPDDGQQDDGTERADDLAPGGPEPGGRPRPPERGQPGRQTRVLGGESPLSYSFGQEQIVFEGEAEGPLFGGCLSLTTSLTGTPYDFWIDGGVWFFEDVDEPVYRIDRMLTHLRLSGRLKKIRAVVIGKLKDCGSDPEIEALLHEFFASSNIPVIRNLPFGHHGDNLLMPVGSVVRVSTRDRTLTFAQPAVRP